MATRRSQHYLAQRVQSPRQPRRFPVPMTRGFLHGAFSIQWLTGSPACDSFDRSFLPNPSSEPDPVSSPSSLPFLPPTLRSLPMIFLPNSSRGLVRLERQRKMGNFSKIIPDCASDYHGICSSTRSVVSMKTWGKTITTRGHAKAKQRFEYLQRNHPRLINCFARKPCNTKAENCPFS